MSNDSPMAHTVRQQFQVSYSYPVVFTSDAFNKVNPTLAELLRSLNCNSSRMPRLVNNTLDGGSS